ncbi:helix-hairpin-helix domain-containing protein [Kitasatospora sp. NPDC002551]|uniref:DNA polymerase Y family protein n=1 Tax=Kitasatospora sp. NPDC002551 TaxID=3154539 RepID=UPI00331C389D
MTSTAATVLHLHLHRAPFETYRSLFTVLGDITPVVQALPPDRALLQLSGAVRYFGLSPADLADLLQTRLAARYGLATTGGIGPNRMLATIAADTATPGTVHVLPDDPEQQLDFLHRQDARRLPGVGPALERKLSRYGISTIGDLAALPPATVQRIAGATTARLLLERAHGTDRRTITPSGPPQTIASTTRFDHDVLDPDEVRRALLHLATDLGARLRAAGQSARAVELQVTYADRSHTTRSRVLPEATGHSPALRDALYALHARLGLQRARVRAVTARAGDLREQVTAAVQLTFDRPTESARALEPVIDRATARFGRGAIAPAALATAASRRANGAGDRGNGGHGKFVDHRPKRA